jgi:hypothetical protein
MAPGILSSPQSSHSAPLSKNDAAPRSIFPDGIRTSGQHPPLYNKLKPYSAFPKEIVEKTLWKKEDYENAPDRWTHAFTDDEVKELNDAADAFIERGIPLTGITKVRFQSLSVNFFL